MRGAVVCLAIVGRLHETFSARAIPRRTDARTYDGRRDDATGLVEASTAVEARRPAQRVTVTWAADPFQCRQVPQPGVKMPIRTTY